MFPDRGIANFITNNLIYEGETDQQTVTWCCNLNAIKKNVGTLTGYPTCDGLAAAAPLYDFAATPYEGPAFFLNG